MPRRKANTRRWNWFAQRIRRKLSNPDSIHSEVWHNDLWLFPGTERAVDSPARVSSLLSGESLMSPAAISMIVFAVVFGSALLGMLLRSALPEQHLLADSKEAVKMSAALVSTMAALVLGLLIASAKSSYDAQNSALVDSSAKVVMLDRVFAHYGPESKDARDTMRAYFARVVNQTWPQNGAEPSGAQAPSGQGEVMLDKIEQLSPQDDNQRVLKSQALSILLDIGQTRWLQYERQAGSVSMPLLITLVFWLAAIFVGFGLLAPRNFTVVAGLFVSAASVSGAILMILEMYNPYAGLIQLSSGPARAALAQLGR